MMLRLNGFCLFYQGDTEKCHDGLRKEAWSTFEAINAIKLWSWDKMWPGLRDIRRWKDRSEGWNIDLD